MPLLSVIIPVYNEKDTILKILEKVQAVGIDKEIIIVDDCSNDGTKEILQNLTKGINTEIKLIYHTQNHGKGAAIRTALDYVKGNIVIIQDADLEQDPDNYPDLIQPIITNVADATIGARKHEGLFYYGFKDLWYTIFGTFALVLIRYALNILYPGGTHIKDVMSGYKALPVAIMKSLNLKSNGFDIETEICAKIKKRNYRMKEVQIKYYPRTYKEGKKIQWWDTWLVIYALIKYKFID